MKSSVKTILALAVLTGVVFGFQACSKSITVPMYAVTAEGIGEKIGTVEARDSDDGLSVTVSVSAIAGGGKIHGFHIHENPDCGPVGYDGTKGAAMAAGGHYDPEGTQAHHGPDGEGHKGDLPFLRSDANGVINMTVTAPRLKLKEIKNRSFIIHSGGDNYKDIPAALGGGGARIACGIIK
ncbi:superoxide dismutase [Parelusimicrobium proximum]|uniref:superoxide dismutase family protein n=1 Tax=Parelusimicrobium proximum TaxID=3228953 RepID=UPI003D182EE1